MPTHRRAKAADIKTPRGGCPPIACQVAKPELPLSKQRLNDTGAGRPMQALLLLYPIDFNNLFHTQNYQITVFFWHRIDGRTKPMCRIGSVGFQGGLQRARKALAVLACCRLAGLGAARYGHSADAGKHNGAHNTQTEHHQTKLVPTTGVVRKLNQYQPSEARYCI